MSTALLSRESSPQVGSVDASREAVEQLADTPITGGRAHDVLRGLRALEDDLTARKVIAPTSRTKTPDPPQPLWRQVVSWIFNGVIVATAIYFWPARFGGSTTAVLVRGTSMLPLYELNDVVIVREQDEYEIGDIVLFEIPEGEAEGMQIIHRITERWPDGTWKTQGDNRPFADQFHLTDDKLIGTPVVHIPKGGRALQLINNTYIIAGAVGAGSVLLMWPQKGAAPGDEDADTRRAATPAGGSPPDPEPEVMPTVAVIGTPRTETARRAVSTAASASADEVSHSAAVAAPDDLSVDVPDPVEVVSVALDPIDDVAIDDDPIDDVAIDDVAIDDVAIDDVDAAAQRWLAEELAALGITL